MDRFKFPEKFYELKFGSTSIHDVKSKFGHNFKVEATTMHVKLVSGPCREIHEKTLEFKKSKLSFQFTEDFKTKNFLLTSIEILEGSPITFGATKMRTGLSHISDVVNEYGLPDETLGIISFDSTYIYRVDQNKIEYSFSFNAVTKLLTSVDIENQIE